MSTGAEVISSGASAGKVGSSSLEHVGHYIEDSTTSVPDGVRSGEDVLMTKNLTTIRSYGVALEEPVSLMDLVQPTHDYTVVVYSAILVFGILANCYMFVRCLQSRKTHHGKTHALLIHVVAANVSTINFASINSEIQSFHFSFFQKYLNT